MLRLKTFGGLVLSSDGLERTQPRRRLALLARLAPSGSAGVSRAELLADLWPERDADTARHNLDQLLYELRQSLDASPVKGTATLRLDPDVITADVMDFISALDRGDCAEAITHYDGAFLQGFYVQGAAEFERWVETARDRLASQHRRALEQLAKQATDRRAHDEAVRLWRRLAADDRLSSRTALGLMRALADAGDSVGALEHARLYDRVVRTELEAAPDPTVMAFAESLRRGDANTTGPKSADPSMRERPTAAPAIASTDDVHHTPNATSGVRSGRRMARYAVFVMALITVGYGTTRWRGDGNIGAGAAGAPMSIVVLPMVDQSVGRTGEHLVDGMTEQLISALGSTEGLHVIGRQSAFAFKGSRSGARVIADSLRVSRVLESALQREGSRLRVTVRLVDGSTGLAQWTETYDRELRDIFALQDDIVHSVARELRVRLTGRGAQRQTTSIAAYELYLRARDPVMTRSDSTVHVAIGLLEQAIALDTGYVAAHAAMAELCAAAVWGSDVGPDGRREMYRRASEAARHAIALDSSSAEAHRARGVVHKFGYEFRDAERELKRARELDPGIQGVAGYLATVYWWTGRAGDALIELQRESRDEPLSAGATAGLTRALYFARQYEQARVEIDKVIALQPPLRRAYQYRAEILLAQRRWSDAIAALRPPTPQLPRVRALLGYALARSGQREEAIRVLERLREGVSTGEGNAFAVAEVYAGLGDLDHAYEWLDRAIDEHTLIAAVMGPPFDDLRADPRFARIQKRLGIETR